MSFESIIGIIASLITIFLAVVLLLWQGNGS